MQVNTHTRVQVDWRGIDAGRVRLGVSAGDWAAWQRGMPERVAAAVLALRIAPDYGYATVTEDA